MWGHPDKEHEDTLCDNINDLIGGYVNFLNLSN